MRQVGEFMSRNPTTCVPEDTCAAAGTLMRKHRREFLPIVDSRRTKKLVGIVTGQDILAQLARRNCPARDLLVSGCMTKSESISAEADFEEGLRAMKRAAVAELPVVDCGRLVGIFTLQDVALAARRQWGYIGAQLTEQHVTEILEAIAVARERQPRWPSRRTTASNGHEARQRRGKR